MRLERPLPPSARQCLEEAVEAVRTFVLPCRDDDDSSWEAARDELRAVELKLRLLLVEDDLARLP